MPKFGGNPKMYNPFWWSLLCADSLEKSIEAASDRVNLILKSFKI